MKKIILSILIITIIISCCGCSLSADNVKLASKFEILRYANKNFGKATCISVDKSEEHKITYILQDKTHGFEYRITSTATGVGMDATNFYYKESKVSNYKFVFFNYIANTKEVQRITNQAGITLNDCHIYTTDTTNKLILVDSIEEIGQLILNYDTKNIFANETIYIEDHISGKWIGWYDFAEQKCTMTDWPSIDEYMEKAKTLFEYADIQVDNIQFIRCEIIPRNDVIGLSNETIKEGIHSNPIEVPCYFFTCDEKEYFIAQTLVKNSGGLSRNYLYCITDNCSIVP